MMVVREDKIAYRRLRSALTGHISNASFNPSLAYRDTSARSHKSSQPGPLTLLTSPFARDNLPVQYQYPTRSAIDVHGAFSRERAEGRIDA